MDRLLPFPPSRTDGAFQLAEWTVEPSLLRLRRAHAGSERNGSGAATERTVGVKVMGVLQCLAERPGEVLSKDELIAHAWDGDAASDEALMAVVYELRRALGDEARSPRFIATVRGRGYRLLPNPEPLAATTATEPPGKLRVGAGLAPARGEEAVPRAPEESPLEDPRLPALPAPAKRVAIAAALLLSAAAGWWIMPFEQPATPPQPTPSASIALAESPSESIRSVAVMELEARARDREHAPSLFARSLSEHLAIDLARSAWLDVVPAFSRAAAATNFTASRPVDAVVEGAVHRRGESWMVTVQLIAADGQLLWGGSWQRPASETTALEAELAGEISRRLRGRLDSTAQLAASPEVDEALRLGHHFLGVDAPAEASRYFRFALERQPTLASAHVGLADALLAGADRQPREERQAAVEQARRAAQTALEIDGDLPAAHASLGTIALMHESDVESAREHFARAAAPGGALADAISQADAPSSSLRGYASFLSAIGRHDEAVGLMRRLMKQSPASVEIRLDLARTLYLAHRLDDALAELMRLDQLSPFEARSAVLRSEILLVQGHYRQAVEACRRAVTLAGGPQSTASLIEQLYQEAGLAGVVRCLRDLGLSGEPAPFAAPLADPLYLARFEAAQGDLGAAMDSILLAEQLGSPDLMWLSVDPAFESLRGLGAFAALANQPS